MEDQRLQSDIILPLIIQRLDRQDKLSDEFRSRTERVHEVMLQKLECLPLMSSKVDHIERWVEGDGKDTVKTVSRAKWMGASLAIGGGAAGGTLIQKILHLFGGGGQ